MNIIADVLIVLVIVYCGFMAWLEVEANLQNKRK